ncbi:class I SAM-dependent methyltransferase [Phytoactinopolyspora halotolerans]|uniref:Methyltransferase domain-containing protein n=1 Tax=Phytoactinopolyspora halotolerans TaxID=1981512 RepID=A0A6L9S1P4_9ACTN|nr:methyltransferase domain-containing protein [Phytoactinopolyspora halotolerans]NED98982.1 methyltransferase domain-containing protein [Phytoactinopolyspora halotolerans]
MTRIDEKAFWERRLAADWTESGVGYHALGRQFNAWVYRVRREVFLREASSLALGATSRVLDVGSGTGVYVRCWKQLGIGDVVGSDLTDAAVERLRERHPDVKFVRADVSRAQDELPAASFDAVSCMDVLFHITDDDRYLAAVQNLARVLRPGGYAVLSENFLHRGPEYTEHQVNRTMPWIVSALEDAGLRVERRVPMLYLMNAQVDAPPIWRKLWGGALRAATLTPPTGWLAGAALFPIERRLVIRADESPTTEMMICRRT